MPLGIAQATEFQVNSSTTYREIFPAVALDNDGDFVVAWHAFNYDSLGIFARRFGASGAPQGIEFQSILTV